MRWEERFDELASAWEAGEQQKLNADVTARTTAEVAALTLADRLRAARGYDVRLGIDGGLWIDGRVSGVGRGWCALARTGQPDAIVLLQAVWSVLGLPVTIETGGHVDSRMPVTVALRQVAEESVETTLLLRDGGTMPAMLDRVGADFVDVRDGGCVPLRALAAVLFRTG